MFNKEYTINLVRSFIKELKQSGITLRKVYLFGSYAKNLQNEFSDIDVAIAADEFTGFGFEDINLFVDIHLKENYYLIQPKTFPSDYFEKGDPFINEIKSTGINIDFRTIAVNCIPNVEDPLGICCIYNYNNAISIA